jgi:8-amino-7-oxononanoate synthase
MHQKLLEKLENRRSKGTFRELNSLDSLIDFYSNDYLGFAREKHTQGSLNGSTGSRLISGNSTEAVKCEQFLATHFNTESALVFNSGYAANLGLLSSVPQRGDVILYDERIHASAKEGMRLSFADSFSFKHHDYSDLERLLHKHDSKITYVVVESFYSMDGTMSHFRKLTQLCAQFNAYLIVDEAHSAGIVGDKGKGVVSALEIEKKVFARIITFGKAFGIIGAAVLGSNDLKNYLVNFARSFIYTTALPEAIYSSISKNVSSDLIYEKQSQLQENITLFRNLFQYDSCISEINSPIQIIQIGNIEKTRTLAETLQRNHFAVKPIFSPTVPEGNECLRLCFHSYDKKEDILQLVSILKSELKS